MGGNVPEHDVNLGINMYETIFDTSMEACVLLDIMVLDSMVRDGKDSHQRLCDVISQLQDRDFVRPRFRLFLKSMRFLHEVGEPITPPNVVTIATAMDPSQSELLGHTMQQLCRTGSVESYLFEQDLFRMLPPLEAIGADDYQLRIDHLKRVTRRRFIVTLAYDIIAAAVEDEPINKPLRILAGRFLTGGAQRRTGGGPAAPGGDQRRTSGAGRRTTAVKVAIS